MRRSFIVGGLLIMLVAVALAGSTQSDEEYSDKQWSMALRLEGKSATVVSMLMSLPANPISVDDSGEPIVHDTYFYRENDRGGNPKLGALIQVSDSSVRTVSIIYNAAGGKKK